MNAQQLRNSILQEAIEGRLVPQDPNDEPASVLLDKIREEKRRLVKEGKLTKKDLVETPISEEEKPFEIPEGWEWVKLGHIFNHSSGKQLSSSNTEGTLHEYITTSNLYWGRFELDNLKSMYYKDSELEKCTAKKGDLLVCEGGDVGRSAIWPFENDICLQNHVHRLRPYDSQYTIFIYYILWFYKHIGLIGGKGIGIQGLSASALKSIVIPLPPLAEQKRIVAKIEELMPKVEEYGKAQEALDKLNTELPEKLKKSILQEAIEGRLVPQDPNDEPASVLLDKIRREKAQLVKEGKLKKKDLVETPISEDEKPFDIPESWEWCRVCDISESFIGLTYKPSDVSEIGWIVLRSSNIQNGQLDYNDIVKVNIDVPEKLHVKQNDIIICARNGSKKLVGKSAIVRNVDVPTTFGAFMAICRTDFYEYMAKYLLSPLFFTQLRKESDTTTINQLTQKNFNKYLVPLPPLAEQHRIVAKIEELFAEIDKLKTK